MQSINWTLASFADLRASEPVGELAKVYLRARAARLEPGGFKALRYSVGLFASRHGQDRIAAITREDGKAFLRDIALLSASLGKSYRYHGMSLDGLLRASERRPDPITVTTQKRIWFMVKGFLD